MVCAMAVPGVIPVAYEPKHRTETIGRYAEGQFLASITYAFPEGFHLEEGGEEKRALPAVLHTSDTEGNHRASDIWCAGPGAEQHRAPRGAPPPLPRAQVPGGPLLRSPPRRSYTDI